MAGKNSEGYQEAFRRITRNYQTKDNELDLGGLGLTELPREVGELRHLRKLVLSFDLDARSENNLSFLPIEIGKLTNLIELDLSFNSLSHFPIEILKLLNLEILNLYGLGLLEIPKDIEKLIKLKKLDLSSNLLSKLPLEFEKLINLEELSLSMNEFAEFPLEIVKLSNLRRLNLEENQIKKIPKEIRNLKKFDTVIVHNEKMLDWLVQKGFTGKAELLGVFDYLSDKKIDSSSSESMNEIVYAGNLIKSKFIYSLSGIAQWKFKIYGPNFNPQELVNDSNLKWIGEYSPEEIVQELKGSFGLIWDGVSIDKCDEILGNYLKYNNPHKFSLYIAAGLPVIAPADSAIGIFITTNKIGLLVNNLNDLKNIKISNEEYNLMKQNILVLRSKVIDGFFFNEAIQKAEAVLLQEK